MGVEKRVCIYLTPPLGSLARKTNCPTAASGKRHEFASDCLSLSEQQLLPSFLPRMERRLPLSCMESTNCEQKVALNSLSLSLDLTEGGFGERGITVNVAIANVITMVRQLLPEARLQICGVAD